MRSENAAKNVEKLGTPHPVFTETVPPAERMSRADLVRISDMYFSGMQQNDGKGVYPFADDCERYENGNQSTNAPTPPGQTRPDPKTASNYSGEWSCKEQFDSGLLHFVSRIRDRRYVAVDQDRGLVFSFIFFDHMAGDTRHFKTPDGRAVDRRPDDAVDVAAGRDVQGREGQDPAHRSHSGTRAVRHGLGLEHLGGGHV